MTDEQQTYWKPENKKVHGSEGFVNDWKCKQTIDTAFKHYNKINMICSDDGSLLDYYTV